MPSTADVHRTEAALGRQARPSAERTIPVRRLDLDVKTAEFDRWLVDRDPIFSHLLAILSAVFPRGEEFFVATVREHRAAVADDPTLKAQVKGFTGQEAMHGREHRLLNARLDELGYRAEETDAGIDRVLTALLMLRPRTLPLAITAAAEHFTGILAEAVLGDEQTREVLFGHPVMHELITWHALEELEHKNVAFDVLERAGGGYVVRIAGLGITTVALSGYVAAVWAGRVAADRHSIGRAELRQFRRNIRRQRLLSPWALRQLVRYVRPGFHPDDTDTDGLVQEWRDRLADRTTVTSGRKRSA